MNKMNYTQAVAYVENIAKFGSKKNGLVNIRELLRRMGNPQEAFPSVHVAGTNGKGSACAVLENILRKAGYKTGLYTSPYLQTFTERIRLRGMNVAEETFARWANIVRAHAEAMAAEGLGKPTFFELTTAICFGIFAEEKVDIAIVEVGLGGRLDATNVLHPILSVIMSIGLDHTQVLGDTVEAIAAEKAGIIKPNIPVVLYPQPFDTAYAALLYRAMEQKSPIYALRDASIRVDESSLSGQTYTLSYQGIMLENLRIPLLGRMQVLNTATAVLAAIVLAQTGKLSLTDQHIREGLSTAVWPGRMEILRRKPFILADGGHNPQGIGELARNIETWFPNRNGIAMMGMLHTHDAWHSLKLLAPAVREVIATQPPSIKALPAADLAEIAMSEGLPVQMQEDWQEALHRGLALAEERQAPLIVTGSLYLVGAVREKLCGALPGLMKTVSSK
ncbi:MAG: bifunctional folylpolyglutamate synthase/dihydrofolate synthase [Christensenellales bacterium]|jgi:dihydrofolate synthase/folylpolyglutamate synthase